MSIVIPNTFKSISTLFSILGFIFIIIALIIFLYEEGLLPKKIISIIKKNKN